MVPHRRIAGVLVGLWACSSSSTSSDSIALPPPCNTLFDDGPTVTAAAVAAAAPAPAGGMISDGAYALTALTAYVGVGGKTGNLPLTASEVQTISGTTLQEDGKINGQESRYTSTISVSGTTISTSDTCPMPGTATHGYTATATNLRIYNTMATFTLEQVYTRR
jgi:hypothetical protein